MEVLDICPSYYPWIATETGVAPTFSTNCDAEVTGLDNHAMEHHISCNFQIFH